MKVLKHSYIHSIRGYVDLSFYTYIMNDLISLKPQLNLLHVFFKSINFIFFSSQLTIVVTAKAFIKLIVNNESGGSTGNKKSHLLPTLLSGGD